MLELSRYEPYPPSNQSSGTISATSSPSSNILTVELSETATDTASVRLDTAAAKPQWQLQVVRDRVDVASRREDHTLIRYHERPVQLGKLFEHLVQVRVVYALALVGVTVQRIEDHGPGVFEDCL